MKFLSMKEVTDQPDWKSGAFIRMLMDLIVLATYFIQCYIQAQGLETLMDLMCIVFFFVFSDFPIQN